MTAVCENKVSLLLCYMKVPRPVSQLLQLKIYFSLLLDEHCWEAEEVQCDVLKSFNWTLSYNCDYITNFQAHRDSSTVSTWTDFRVKVTFCHWWSESTYSNPVDVELKIQLSHCYLSCFLSVIFSSSHEEEVSLYSRLKREDGKSPITIPACNGYSHFLLLPPARRKLHRFRQIRCLTKWEKDIIPFVLV